MRAAPKPGIVAAGVLLASAGPWTGLQAALAAAHGRESAAVELRAIARVGRAALPATDNGVSFWGPLVASGTIQLLALSLLALAFVMAGRRRSWALGAVLFVDPVLTEPAVTWLRPIGFGWSGPWVQAGTAVGAQEPSVWSVYRLGALGAVVDVLVVAVPAVVYLLLTRRSDRRAVLPALHVARRLALPVGLAVLASTGYAVLDGNGQGSAQTVALALVPLAVGLLATTRLGAGRAVGVVATAAVLASPAAGYLTWSAQRLEISTDLGTALTGFALPFAALAALGAVLSVSGPAAASAYRRLVRRPDPTVSAA
jgi:hypothetical protein